MRSPRLGHAPGQRCVYRRPRASRHGAPRPRRCTGRPAPHIGGNADKVAGRAARPSSAPTIARNVDTYIAAVSRAGAEARDARRPNADGSKTLRETSSFTADRRPSTASTGCRPTRPKERDMAAFAYDAINAQGLELAASLHAPDVGAAREQLRSRGLLAQDAERAAPRRRGRREDGVQEGQAEVAAGLRAPARDDDRGRRQRRRGARDARGADGRQVPRAR